MNKRTQSVVSILTAVLFILTQVVLPLPAWAVEGTGAQPLSVKTHSDFELAIPSELGTVQHLVSGNGPTLIHIQTAHGNYEAQKKIETLLHYLKDHYGIKTVFIEGSVSKLEPEVLRLFPDRMELTTKILDDLTHKAIIKGVDLFLLDEREAAAYGIEDDGAYRANLSSFKAVLTEQEKTGGFVRDMDLQIERLTSPFLNGKLRTFLKQEARFESKTFPFMEWLSYLKGEAQRNLSIDLDDPAYQLEWPMLLRIFKLKDFEARLDAKKLAAETPQFLRAVQGVPKDTYEEVEKLLTSPLGQGQLSDPGTGLLFESMVSALPKDFNYDAYPNVKIMIGHLILQSEVKGDLLMAEINQLTELILDRLAENEPERKILGLLKDHRLLSRLFSLELTPEDYEAILARRHPEAPQGPKDLRPSEIIRHFQELNASGRVRDVKFTHLEEIDSLFGKALEFYRGVKARDGAMLRNIEKRLEETGEKKAVVITGGFHAGPFQEHFSKEGFNYALVAPRISSLEGRSAYVDSILEKSTVESPDLADPQKTWSTEWMASEISGSIVTAAGRTSTLSAEGPNVGFTSTTGTNGEISGVIVHFDGGLFPGEKVEVTVPVQTGKRITQATTVTWTPAADRTTVQINPLTSAEPVEISAARSEVRAIFKDLGELRGKAWWKAMEPQRRAMIARFFGPMGKMITVPADHNKPERHFKHPELTKDEAQLAIFTSMALYVDSFLINPENMLGRRDLKTRTFIPLEKIHPEANFGPLELHPSLPRNKLYVVKWEHEKTPSGDPKKGEADKIGNRPRNQGETLPVTLSQIATIPQIIGIKFMVYIDSSQPNTLDPIVEEVKVQSIATHEAGLLFFPEDLPAKGVNGKSLEEAFIDPDEPSEQVRKRKAIRERVWWEAENPLVFAEALARHKVDFDTYKFTPPGSQATYPEELAMTFPDQPERIMGESHFRDNLRRLRKATEGRLLMQLSGGAKDTAEKASLAAEEELPIVGFFPGRGVWGESFWSQKEISPDKKETTLAAIEEDLRFGGAKTRFIELNTVMHQKMKPFWQHLGVSQDQVPAVARSEARQTQETLSEIMVSASEEVGRMLGIPVSVILVEKLDERVSVDWLPGAPDIKVEAVEDASREDWLTAIRSSELPKEKRKAWIDLTKELARSEVRKTGQMLSEKMVLAAGEIGRSIVRVNIILEKELDERVHVGWLDDVKYVDVKAVKDATLEEWRIAIWSSKLPEETRKAWIAFTIELDRSEVLEATTQKKSFPVTLRPGEFRLIVNEIGISADVLRLQKISDEKTVRVSVGNDSSEPLQEGAVFTTDRGNAIQVLQIEKESVNFHITINPRSEARGHRFDVDLGWVTLEGYPVPDWQQRQLSERSLEPDGFQAISSNREERTLNPLTAPPRRSDEKRSTITPWHDARIKLLNRQLRRLSREWQSALHKMAAGVSIGSVEAQVADNQIHDIDMAMQRLKDRRTRLQELRKIAAARSEVRLDIDRARKMVGEEDWNMVLKELRAVLATILTNDEVMALSPRVLVTNGSRFKIVVSHPENRNETFSFLISTAPDPAPEIPSSERRKYWSSLVYSVAVGSEFVLQDIPPIENEYDAGRFLVRVKEQLEMLSKKERWNNWLVAAAARSEERIVEIKAASHLTTIEKRAEESWSAVDVLTLNPPINKPTSKIEKVTVALGEGFEETTVVIFALASSIDPDRYYQAGNLVGVSGRHYPVGADGTIDLTQQVLSELASREDIGVLRIERPGVEEARGVPFQITVTITARSEVRDQTVALAGRDELKTSATQEAGRVASRLTTVSAGTRLTEQVIQLLEKAVAKLTGPEQAQVGAILGNLQEGLIDVGGAKDQIEAILTVTPNPFSAASQQELQGIVAAIPNRAEEREAGAQVLPTPTEAPEVTPEALQLAKRARRILSDLLKIQGQVSMNAGRQQSGIAIFNQVFPVSEFAKARETLLGIATRLESGAEAVTKANQNAVKELEERLGEAIQQLDEQGIRILNLETTVFPKTRAETRTAAVTPPATLEETTALTAPLPELTELIEPLAEPAEITPSPITSTPPSTTILRDVVNGVESPFTGETTDLPPNIPSLFPGAAPEEGPFVLQDGQVFVAEVAGQTLRMRLVETLSPKVLAGLLSQLLGGRDVAYAQGIRSQEVAEAAGTSRMAEEIGQFAISEIYFDLLRQKYEGVSADKVGSVIFESGVWRSLPPATVYYLLRTFDVMQRGAKVQGRKLVKLVTEAGMTEDQTLREIRQKLMNKDVADLGKGIEAADLASRLKDFIQVMAVPAGVDPGTVINQQLAETGEPIGTVLVNELSIQVPQAVNMLLARGERSQVSLRLVPFFAEKVSEAAGLVRGQRLATPADFQSFIQAALLRGDISMVVAVQRGANGSVYFVPTGAAALAAQLLAAKYLGKFA